jgi:Ca2+-binding EF-hand superfamily protein
MALKNGLIDIQAAGYNGARTVSEIIFNNFSSEATKKKMFEMMDKDASGGISKAELAQWIKSTQEMDSEAEDVEEEVVTAEFNRIDSNQDGQLRSVHVLLSKLYPDF